MSIFGPNSRWWASWPTTCFYWNSRAQLRQEDGRSKLAISSWLSLRRLRPCLIRLYRGGLALRYPGLRTVHEVNCDRGLLALIDMSSHGVLAPHEIPRIRPLPFDERGINTGLARGAKAVTANLVDSWLVRDRASRGHTFQSA